MGSVRTWIYRILILAAAGFMLYTWFQPWWRAWIVELKVFAVSIFPYGMEINLGNYPQWLAGADNVMPAWFTPFMWGYLIVCMLFLLIAMFISGRKTIGFGSFQISLPKALISFVGLSYIAVAVAAVLVISANAGNFYDGKLQGSIFVSIDEHTESFVDLGLTMGYWLACAVGPVLIILAALRNQIIGKMP